jgi:hypothetical protein
MAPKKSKVSDYKGLNDLAYAGKPGNDGTTVEEKDNVQGTYICISDVHMGTANHPDLQELELGSWNWVVS